MPFDHEVVLLGYFVNAEGLVNALKKENPELIKKILVIDFNLKNHPKIKAHGLNVVYGDIGNPETLRHFGIDNAKVVISTISDLFLRGTSNEDLLDFVKSMNPQIRFISTAETEEKKVSLRKRGSYAVVSPPDMTAPEYIRMITEALDGKLGE